MPIVLTYYAFNGFSTNIMNQLFILYSKINKNKIVTAYNYWFIIALYIWNVTLSAGHGYKCVYDYCVDVKIYYEMMNCYTIDDYIYSYLIDAFKFWN